MYRRQELLLKKHKILSESILYMSYLYINLGFYVVLVFFRIFPQTSIT